MSNQRLRPSEEFLILFNALREATKYDPNKLKRFYDQSETIKNASDALYWFMMRTHLETMVDHGRRFHRGLPKRFPTEYQDYKLRWKDPVAYASGLRFTFDLEGLESAEFSAHLPTRPRETERPDFDFDENFDPRYHNAGEVMDIGLGHLADRADEELNDDHIRNLCRIAVEGSEYLHQVIGIDLVKVAARYRRIPVTFVPDHVSSALHLGTEGLFALLDDAVRAYVAGAPNAAIAMCRAVLEKLLKVHYGRDDFAHGKLEDLIDFCAKQYAWVARSKEPLQQLRKLANRTLHSPSVGSTISLEDEGILLAAFGNLKFLIEKAPSR